MIMNEITKVMRTKRENVEELSHELLQSWDVREAVGIGKRPLRETFRKEEEKKEKAKVRHFI